MKTSLGNSGYLFLDVSKTRYVHRLVAAAFHGKCPPGKVVNHKDGKRTNNSASNLEYVTQSENVLHAYRMGLAKPPPKEKNHRYLYPERFTGELSPNAKLNNEQVLAIREEAANGARRMDLAKKYRVGIATIYDVVSRRRWGHV